MLRFIVVIAVFSVISLTAHAQHVWTQSVETQPSVERGATGQPPESIKPEIEDSVFAGGVVPNWIWGPNNAQNYVLRTSVELSDVKSARLKASCDNVGTVFINGKRVASSGEWQEPMDVDVTASIVPGKNVIEAAVANEGGIAAFVLKLAALTNDGRTIEVVTDETWQFAEKRGDESTQTVALRATYGEGPWGAVFNIAAVAGRVPAGTFELLPGFHVEKLFAVPKEELGSWVCIAFDNKGRLLASDQGDKGIYRITLPPVNFKSQISNLKSGQNKKTGEKEEQSRTAEVQPLAEGETKVERLDFSQCEFKPTGAHGMLWAFDSLYFSCNGGPGSGLYRARDTDGDDVFDECVRLKEFGGGGEHGPHSIRLSPDGKRIFVIAGNHTKPPFKPGDELTNKDYTSRVPTNWGEDLLLPRMWDANGHAVGILAPGGWIASTDPDGKTWDIWSVGYRNPYDMAFNADGELYFSVGGRGTPSELFRAIYTGDESCDPAKAHDSKEAGPRSRRRVLEASHAGRAPGGLQNPLDTDTYLNGLRDDIRSGDRFLKTASRNAFYNTALIAELLKPSALETAKFSDTTPDELLGIVTALAKAPMERGADSSSNTEGAVLELKQSLQRALLRNITHLKFETLSTEQQLYYLRALSLVFVRLAEPDDSTRAKFDTELGTHFPCDNDDLNRELCQMLVYLKSPTVIEKTVKLLEAPSRPTVSEDMQDLLTRNRGYGGAIAASIEKAPDQQQIWYAFCLRNLKEGWTMDQRKAYFSWFELAHTWAGGASFHGFLNNIERECFENASEKERLLIEASGARKPYTLPEIPKPAGPGKDWTLEDVRTLAADGLKNRDFKNGQKMFAATRCVICHRFAGDGGAAGPDLTQLAGRFNLNDLTEAIMLPSKVISDQYKASTIATADGKSISGRILSENDEIIAILTHPEDPTKIAEIQKSDIDDIVPSAVSIMPADLLKPLNQDEDLDLLAYLLSRGDKGSGMFRK